MYRLRSYLIVFLPLALLGCYPKDSLSIQGFNRNNNKVSLAVWDNLTYTKGGVIKMTHNGKVYSGSPVKVDESNLFGFFSRYGNSRSFSSSGSFLTTYFKAILSSLDDQAIRCDIVLSNSGGTGICLDDQQVIDIVLTQN